MSGAYFRYTVDPEHVEDFDTTRSGMHGRNRVVSVDNVDDIERHLQTLRRYADRAALLDNILAEERKFEKRKGLRVLSDRQREYLEIEANKWRKLANLASSETPRAADAWLSRYGSLYNAVQRLVSLGYARRTDLGYDFTLKVGTVAHLLYDYDFRDWSQVEQYITIADKPTTGNRLRASANKAPPAEYRQIDDLLRRKSP